MAELNVFLATAGPAQGIRDVLTDLSAAGLVDPFLWIEHESITGGGGRVAGVEVANGIVRPTILQETLASRSFDKVRLCVLVPFLDSAPAAPVGAEQALADVLASNAGMSRLVRLRLLLARKGGVSDASAVPALAGWHNLLLAPEDARGPRMGHESLAAPADAVAVGRHAAPMIAGLMGLWTGAEHTPFDDEQPLPGNAIRVVRSYYRRLDTAQAEESLRRQVLDADGALPLPRDVGESVIYVDDVLLANSTMANALWHKHKDLLKGARVPYPVVEPSRKIGALRALKMFFAFLGAALRNAPMAWYSNITNKMSSTVASAVHSTVFGSAQSAYTVVVKGVRADGRHVSWRDLAKASSQMSSALGGDGRTQGHQQHTDLSAVWRDYAAGALTLSDAGERVTGLAPIQIGANRAVLRQASDAVPGPRERFTDIPGIVGASAGVSALEPTDAMGVHDFQQRLRVMEQDQSLGLDARRTNSVIGGWLQRIRSSYGYRVGEILARELFGSIEDVRQLLARLEAAGRAEDPGEAARKRQKRLALWSQIVSVLAVIVIIAAVVLWQQDRIPFWWKTAGILSGTLLAWMTILALIFMRGQQELFQLINARQRREQVVEIDQANLRTALRDVDRLAAAYGQHQSWSQSIGAFLESPLGKDEQAKTSSRRIDWGLPLNAAIGYAAPDVDALATVSSYLRQDLFRVGWLSGPWTSLVNDAGTGQGAAGEVIRQNPEAIWTQPGINTGSALDIWATRMRSGEVSATGGAVLWARALTDLAGPKHELTRKLTEIVEFRVDDSQRHESMTDFVAGVGVPLAEGEGGFFDRSVFTDVAATRGAAAVERTTASTSRNGLGLIAVSTQFSAGVFEEDLRLAGRMSPSFGGTAGHTHWRGADTGGSQDSAFTAGHIEIPLAEGLDF